MHPRGAAHKGQLSFTVLATTVGEMSDLRGGRRWSRVTSGHVEEANDRLGSLLCAAKVRWLVQAGGCRNVDISSTKILHVGAVLRPSETH